MSDDVIRDLLQTHPHLAKYLSSSTYLQDLPTIDGDLMDDLSLRFADFLPSLFKKALTKKDLDLCVQCLERMADYQGAAIDMDESNVTWLLSQVAEKGELRLLLRLSDVLPPSASSRIDEFVHQMMLSSTFSYSDLKTVLQHGQPLSENIWQSYSNMIPNLENESDASILIALLLADKMDFSTFEAKITPHQLHTCDSRSAGRLLLYLRDHDKFLGFPISDALLEHCLHYFCAKNLPIDSLLHLYEWSQSTSRVAYRTVLLKAIEQRHIEGCSKLVRPYRLFNNQSFDDDQLEFLSQHIDFRKYVKFSRRYGKQEYFQPESTNIAIFNSLLQHENFGAIHDFLGLVDEVGALQTNFVKRIEKAADDLKKQGKPKEATRILTAARKANILT